VAIGTACIWIGDQKSAQFFVLENTKHHAAGRCREIALLEPLEVKHLMLKDVNENGRTFRVVAVKVDRDKQGGSQTLPLFPHRDHTRQDICFALACNLLVNRWVDSHLFDDFAVRAKRHLNGLTKSNVSQLWSSCFKKLFKQFGEIPDQVNLSLKSRHDKNGSNQKLAENPLTAGLPQVFHSRWDVRSVHTLFEHAVGSESMSRQTGKALLNWSSSVDMGIVGGEPPNMHDIRGEDNLRMARVMCSFLFKDDMDCRWSPAIQETLFASVLRFYPDLVKLLQELPTSKCADLKSHPFMRILNQCLDDVRVDIRMFNDWCVDVRKGFMQRNCISLPLDMLTRNGHDGLNEIRVDTRSFLAQVNALTKAYVTVSSHVVSIGVDAQRVVDQHDKLEGMLQQVLDHLDDIKKDESDDSERLACSDAISSCQPRTPARLVVTFFKDSLHVLCHAQLKTKKWKELDQKERGGGSQLAFAVRRGV